MRTFAISNEALVEALVGRLADVTLEGGETVRVRIKETTTSYALVQEVDPSTKE